MEMIQEYIVPVVLLICLVVGFLIKNCVPGEKVNSFIPMIVAVLGVILTVWNSGWQFTPVILLEGLASGLASTGMYEMFAQFLKRR